jgi:hypothetical protein
MKGGTGMAILNSSDQGLSAGDRDLVGAAINRLPAVIQEDVHRLLSLHYAASAKACLPKIFNDDEAMSAAYAVIKAYEAALHSIAREFGEPDLAPDGGHDDAAESFDGSLNIDAGSPASAFPPFLRAQLDRRA